MTFHKKDRFGHLKRPSLSTAGFKEAKRRGFIEHNQTRRQFHVQWRKNLRKRKIAKLSRRKNRRMR